MAGINPVPTENFGNLLTSFPQGMAAAAQGQASAGLMQAQVPLVQQQTIGANLANQRSALELNLMRQFMMQSQSQDQNSGKENQSGVDPSEQGIQHAASVRFQPADPLGTQQDQARVNASWWNPQLRTAMEAARDKNVQGENIRRQASANEAFEAGYGASISDAPMEYLKRSQNPFIQNMVAAIKSQYPKEQWDDQAKSLGANVAKYTHQYTGRETEYNTANEPVDKVTKFPLGLPTPGLKPQEKVDFGKWQDTTQEFMVGNAPARLTPRQVGITSPERYLQAINNGIIPTIAPDGTPFKGSKTSSTPPSPLVQTQGLPPEVVDMIKNGPKALGTESVPGYAGINPRTDKAYADFLQEAKTFKDKYSNLQGQAQRNLAQIDRMNKILPTLTNYGPGSQGLTEVHTFMSNFFGSDQGRAAGYQMLQKVMGAQQVEELLSAFHGDGAQVRLGAYETRIFMTMLNANPNMTPLAMKQLLNWNASDAHYEDQKSNAAIAWVNNMRDPGSFERNYNQTVPRTKAVDTDLSAWGNFSSVNLKTIPFPLSTNKADAAEEFARLKSGQHFRVPGESQDRIKP